MLAAAAMLALLSTSVMCLTIDDEYAVVELFDMNNYTQRHYYDNFNNNIDESIYHTLSIREISHARFLLEVEKTPTDNTSIAIISYTCLDMKEKVCKIDYKVPTV